MAEEKDAWITGPAEFEQSESENVKVEPEKYMRRMKSAETESKEEEWAERDKYHWTTLILKRTKRHDSL